MEEGRAEMIVWVWDAHGPDRSAGGVADDEKHARRLARESLLRTGASEVLIEQALTAFDAATLIYGYARTGQQWRGHRTPSGRITWRKLPDTAVMPRRTAS